MVKNRSDLVENLKKLGSVKPVEPAFSSSGREEEGHLYPLPPHWASCAPVLTPGPPLSLMGSADEVNMTTYHGLPGGIPGHTRA